MDLAELHRIDRSIAIKSTPEQVYRALTDEGELSAWFEVSIEGEIAAGNLIWMTSEHEGHVGQRFQVRIVEMTPPLRVVWEWHPGAIDPSVDYEKEPWTTVTFTVEPAGIRTTLHVAETGFDAISLERRAKVFGDNSEGWSEVLGWFKRHVEAEG